jgi:response regulator RpfG family c-di-GMP phosphodiesterase
MSPRSAELTVGSPTPEFLKTLGAMRDESREKVPAPEPSPKGRVLIVDDESRIAGLLSTKLSREGFECHECSSGEQALEILAREEFDLILSDIRMPGMSGLELLAAVQEKHPRSAFVLVTAEDDIHVSVQAMKHGAADYLLKPFRLDAVLKSAVHAVERKRLENELGNYRSQLELMVEQRTQELQTAMKRVELTYDETLEALAAALDLRDNETAGHSRRVTLYCREIALAMGVPADQLKQIARGAYLHDIGKIGIPDAILLQPRPLTPAEKTIMETHPYIGYDLVGRIAFLSSAAEIVLAHQEKYDGTGYPRRLMGEEIPLGARIFAVADTLDAMTSDRPYRQAQPFAAAREEIAKQSGQQFDPSVVKAFLSVPEKVWKKVIQELPQVRPLQASPPVRAL